MCSCYPGYELVDKKKCMANNRTQSFQVYFAQDKNIMKMDSKYQNQMLVANATSASGMDYHYTLNTLFWSDVKLKKIKAMQLLDTKKFIRDGNAIPPEITLPGMWEPISVAVDWVGNKLYVVDGVGQKIDVFELNGRWHSIVLSSNLTNPSDIALDPTKGYMFIADGNQLIRANMDAVKPKLSSPTLYIRHPECL